MCNLKSNYSKTTIQQLPHWCIHIYHFLNLFRWDCYFLNWFLLLPVCETVGCSCPFNQRSGESRCAIVSEVVSWLICFPSASPRPTLAYFGTLFIFAYGWIHFTNMAVIKNKVNDSREIKKNNNNNRGVAENPLALFTSVMLGFCVCVCVGGCIISELPYTKIDQIIAINCLEAK